MAELFEFTNTNSNDYSNYLNYQPEPKTLDVTPRQILALVVVAVASVLSILLNSILFCGCLLVQRPKVGFDVLVMNLLLVNFCLTVFIYPYDVVSYIVLNKAWPFAEFYCHVSTFFTSFLPFVGCWNVSIMALQQFFSLLTMVLDCVPSSKSKTTAVLQKFAPTVLVWLHGFGIHCPIAYSLWTVQTGPLTCALEGENGLLHDSIWYFWIPLSASVFGLIAIVIVAFATLTRIPAVDQTNHHFDPVVHWSQHSPTQVDSANAFFDPTALDVGLIVPDHDDHEPPSPRTDAERNPYGNRSTTAPAVEPVPAEITLHSLKVTLLLTGTLAVFTGPYALFLMIFHFNLHNPETPLEVWFWDVGFTLMCCKALAEPLLLLMFAKYRKAAAFWTWRKR
ncbi:uncharacterized protein LOC129599677 [Paramacrobiotus metropolitanus]|uniref:uncharacterized protein LOC129599677 n=1 Tax=Paramacrobiotus metropolitanus TaxID=2943436 RepID=UPI0024459B92|nr:uncharacterized protein LOC129599677 [Paramacrobiotus metropolitanus]